MVLGQHAERVASLEATTYAYAIRAALRRCGLFLKATSSSKAIGLALPPDADSDAYSEAAKAILRQTETLKHYAVTSVFLGRRGDSHVEKAHSVLEERSAVVVLIEHGAALPAAVAVALDRIVEVGPVKAIHLMSAAKSAWQTEILKEAAQELCGYPPELLFRALRDGRPIDIVLEKLAAASKAPATTAWEPRVEELEGYGEARDWAADLVVDLADWGAGTLAWRDVDAGLLLSGPPGTGKTLFASALARSCGAKFIGTSSAQWQSKGHLGDMLGAMRKSFREAADAAPSVLFIDEFDSIGDRRTFRGDNASYSLQVVNALLELLDGSTGREGVIVIAASNFPDHIDPALRRPGRLDRHVAIDLPDQEARQQMLSMHLGTADAPEDLLKAALATSGYSGADLAQVAKDARRVARRQGREARVSDVLAIVPPRRAHRQRRALVGIRTRGRARAHRYRAVCGRDRDDRRGEGGRPSGWKHRTRSMAAAEQAKSNPSVLPGRDCDAAGRDGRREGHSRRYLRWLRRRRGIRSSASFGSCHGHACKPGAGITPILRCLDVEGVGRAAAF